MNYSDFKKSMSSNKIHKVSHEETLDSKLQIQSPIQFPVQLEEPLYALKTSGTTTNQKTYLHKLSGIEAAAGAFLRVFPLNNKDCWGLCLSTKHVSGFSILARSHFGGLRPPLEFKWSAADLFAVVTKNNLTVLSLVPAQIFDLVRLKVKAPRCLTHLFVGGAFLSKKTLNAAKALGWPIVLCYGSTETFAQMSYSLDGVLLKAFPDWLVKVDPAGELLLKGPGLYWAEITKGLLVRERGWFKTGDLGRIKNEGEFTLSGRANGRIKIKGSYFDFDSFKRKLSTHLENKGLDAQDFFPVALEEERNGAGLYLMCTGSLKKADCILREDFGEESFFRGVFRISTNVFGAAGKVDRLKLEAELSRTVVYL